MVVRLLSPPGGGLFNFGHSRVGLVREGSLFTEANDKDIQ